MPNKKQKHSANSVVLAPQNKNAPAKAPVRQATASPLEDLGLPADVSVELLQALHILTRDARLNQDSRRKLKQVLHLVQFIEPLIQEVAQKHEPVLVDHGAGKSYLGFLLYDLVMRPLQQGQVIGVEFREDLVQKSQALAQRQSFTGMRFLPFTVAESSQHSEMPAKVDIVTALHACDTATDDAIAFGLAKRAGAMVLVPCCQAEVAANLRANKAMSLARTPLAELWRHPIHTRELGSHLTNVMRCLYLEATGYQVTVTELIGWEHSMKNELILARWTGQRKRSARERLLSIAAEMGLDAWAQKRFPLVALATELSDDAVAGA